MASIEPRCIHKISINKGESAPSLDGAVEVPGPLDVPPVDAFEEHRQLCRRERNGAALCLRPHEAALLETLGKETKTITIEPEALDDVTSSAAEEKEMTGEGLHLKNGLHLRAQPMKAAAHVRDASRDPDPGPRRKLDHLPTL